MLGFLSKKLGITEYKGVLRRLGLGRDDNTLEDIEHRYHSDVQEMRFQSLTAWVDKFGFRQATVRKLVNAMLEEDLRRKAEEFCNKFDMGYLIDGM